MYDWIDQRLGTQASVTVVPYLVSSNWFASQKDWEDVEFWNKSVVRDALEASDDGGNAFAYTGIWFPKTQLRFDPATGLANVSPTRWVAASDKDTRFAIAGIEQADVGDVELVEADEPWRAAWISFGLYDDGWTKPGVTARIRVFPYPGQRRARIRVFAFAVHSPADVASQPCPGRLQRRPLGRPGPERPDAHGGDPRLRPGARVHRDPDQHPGQLVGLRRRGELRAVARLAARRRLLRRNRALVEDRRLTCRVWNAGAGSRVASHRATRPAACAGAPLRSCGGVSCARLSLPRRRDPPARSASACSAGGRQAALPPEVPLRASRLRSPRPRPRRD